MSSGKKTLVILETSVIRNPNAPFGNADFGAGFRQIKKFLDDTHNQSAVDIAVPRMALNELIVGRTGEYRKDREELFSRAEKLAGVPGMSFVGNGDEFDYQEYISKKLEEYIESEGIIVIENPPSAVWDSVIQRSLNKNTPFIPGGDHTDYGFKDVVIWEAVLNFPKISEYGKVILFTNDKGFDGKCINEFTDRHDCYFEIMKDASMMVNRLEKDLEVGQISEPDAGYPSENYEDESLMHLVESDYFKDAITEYVVEKLSIQPSCVQVFDSTMLIERERNEDGQIAQTKVIVDIGIYNEDGPLERKSIEVYVDDANGIEGVSFL